MRRSAAAAGAGGGGLFFGHAGEGAGREELAHGETDLAEDLAGIFVALLVSAGALAGGHAVVVHGDEQLGVPLQADHGELPQGDVQPAAAAVKGQVTVEAGADAGGDLGQLVLRAAPAGRWRGRTRPARTAGGRAGGRTDQIAGIQQLQVQHDGVHGLHHGLWQVAPAQDLAVRSIGVIAGGENFCAAFTAEEQHPLVEHGQPADLRRAGAADKGLCGDAVVVADVHAVKAPVVAGGLYVDVRLQQLGPAPADAEGAVDHSLGGTGGVDPQVLDAVLIPAAVVDLLGVDTNGFPDAAAVLHGSGYDPFVHSD